MALTLIANLDPGLQCRNTLNAVIDLVGANHPWTSGSIPYTDSTNDYAQDNSNFFWDATSKLLTSGNGLKLKGTSSGVVTLNTKAVAGTWALTLPDSGGTSGYVLSTDGAGVTSWTAAGGGGGGTIILSGSGVPADALGSIGDCYVDEDGNQMYGPKVVAGGVSYGPDQSAIPPSEAPVTFSSGPIEIGNHILFAAAGQIVAVRYWRGTFTTQIARKVNVWTTGGTRLGSGTVANDGGGLGWKQVALTTPVMVAASTTLIVSVDATGSYDRTDSPTYPISNGGDISITAGSYNGSVDTFPNSAYASNFFTDAVFQAEVAVPVWPMAVDGDVGTPIGGTIAGGTAGRVLFTGTGGILDDDSTFLWNDTLKDLAIGGAYYVNAARALYVVPHVTENNWFEGNAGNQTVTGYGNFGTGDLALSNVTSGYDNVAMGTNSLKSITSGYNNFAQGSYALRNSQTDQNNVAIGYRALELAGIGGVGGGNNSTNVAIGFAALGHCEQAGSNVVIGDSGLSKVGASTTATQNTVVGSGAGTNLGLGGGSTVGKNTIIGCTAGLNLTGASSSNTFLGRWSGPSGTINNCVAISEGDGLYALLDFNICQNYGWSFNAASNGIPTSVHIYNSQSVAFSSGGNYERAVLDWRNVMSNVFVIRAEAQGSGVQRNIAIGGFPKAGAPVAGDLPSGTFSLIDDTSAGQTWLVFNKAGTIRKVQLT